MTVQQNLIAGVCLAIGIASVGFSLKAGIDHYVDRDRVVTVKGLAERTVLAGDLSRNGQRRGRPIPNGAAPSR